jgi:PhzF family phenazine biosynthesis protein
MEIPYFTVNAFAPHRFAGSPVQVFLPRDAPSREVLASIAADVAPADSAFLFRSADAFHIRWFNGDGELSLCAHATLAAASVVLRHLEPTRGAVTFGSQSGPIHVARREDLFVTDFPRLLATPCDSPQALLRGLSKPPREVLRAGKFMVVFSSEEEVRALSLDLEELATLDTAGVILTAPGLVTDFVVRSVAIANGRAVEESVSGSAHTRLVPYWSQVAKKKRLVAAHVSARPAEVVCEDDGSRVHLAGRAFTAAQGTLFA